MRGLAAFIMKDRISAVLTICALTILSWIVSLVGLLAAAAIALLTLRKGALEGALVMVAAVIGVTAVGGILLGHPLRVAEYALVLWVPVWLIAILLRGSGHLAFALVSAMGLGMLMVVGIYAIYDDPATIWLNELQQFVKPFLERKHSGADAELLWRNFVGFSRYMTGIVAAGSMLTLSLSLLIARWWQAVLFNPSGFRAEFLNLHMPAASAYLWLGLLAFAWIGGDSGSEIACNLAIPFLMLFLLTGFAILHALFSNNGSGGFWLAGIYVALIFMSPLIVLIMLIGFSDTWIDWRHRFLAA
jgi:hypothetical protein